MQLLIEPADNNNPLDKQEMEVIVGEIRSQGLPVGIDVSLREREPRFGELASFAHVWQVVVGTGGVTALGTFLYKVLPIVLRPLEIRQQQRLKLKVGGISLEAPARMSSDELTKIVDHLAEAAKVRSKKAAPKRSPKGRVAPPKKATPSKAVSTQSKSQKRSRP